MAEIVGEIKAITGGTREQTIINDTMTVETTTTIIVGKRDCEWAEAKDVSFNENSGNDITVKVWKSNMAAPKEIGVTNWENDWSQIGDNITVSGSGEESSQWVTRSKWFAISATAASQSVSLDTRFRMTGSVV